MKNLNTFKLLSDYESEKSGGVLNTPNVSFVTEDNSVRYLLEYPTTGTENGYEWVDLGLPSGTKWATCNVGASNPQDYGLYFAWGETTGYTGEQVTSGVRMFDNNTYKAGPAASISTDITLEQDAAHTNLGGNWRMPTKIECYELINNCTTTWTEDYNGTGVAGRIITSKSNDNSIFLPAAGDCGDYSVSYVGSDGFYLSSSWYSRDYNWLLRFNSETIIRYNRGSRCFGQSVRGVCK